jgi:hypothetical protein
VRAAFAISRQVAAHLAARAIVLGSIKHSDVGRRSITILGAKSAMIACLVLALDACSSQPAANATLPQVATKAQLKIAAVSATPGPVTMLLSDGETVTIQPAPEPPTFVPSQVPAAVLAAVRNHQDLSMGSFHAIVEVDDMSWAAGLPPPSSEPTRSSRGPGLRTDSATGASADHSAEGWFVNGYDSNPDYQSEGYIQFDADMGLPTLYPEEAGGSGSYVYYAPTTQGLDGNPFEVGLATEPDYPSAGPQHLFIYNWAATDANVPCSQTGYAPCEGFASYAPTINSTFASDYVRVLTHGVPEWSIATLQDSNGYWYFGIYNHNTDEWDFPYYWPYTAIRHNFTTGENGLAGGHGYFEYYLPPNTACAGSDPDDPSTADVYETDAQDYSNTTDTWTRISAEQYMFSGLTGLGTCFAGPNSPYFSVGDFGDGWSDWEAIWV